MMNGRPHLVMIPGFMCDARLFAAQMAGLTGVCRPQVILPDARLNTIPALADAVLSAAPPRFALLGLSMGAIIAMEMVRQSPGRIQSVMFWSCSAAPDTAEKQASRQIQIAAVQAGGLTEVMHKDHIPFYFADGEEVGTRQICADMANHLGPEAFVNHSRALMARADRRPDLAKVKMPSLVACGMLDRLCPPERHDEIQQRIPNAMRARLPDAGHLPPLQTPEAVNREITKFLDRQSPK